MDTRLREYARSPSVSRISNYRFSSARSDDVAIFGGCAEQLELRGILQSSRNVHIQIENTVALIQL